MHCRHSPESAITRRFHASSQSHVVGHEDHGRIGYLPSVSHCGTLTGLPTTASSSRVAPRRLSRALPRGARFSRVCRSRRVYARLRAVELVKRTHVHTHARYVRGRTMRRRNGDDVDRWRMIVVTRMHTTLALSRLAERYAMIPPMRPDSASRLATEARGSDPIRRDASRVSARAATLFKTIYNRHTNQRTSHPVRMLALSAFSRHRRAPLRGFVSVSPLLPSITRPSLTLSLSLPSTSYLPLFQPTAVFPHAHAAADQ